MKNKSLETRLKTEISTLLSNSDLTVELAKDTLDGLTRFVNNDLVYFEGSAYHDDNLNLLFTAIHQYYYMTFRAYFLHKYNLLNFQKDIYRGS